MKIMTVIGTRPEAIKLAPVVHALEKRGAEVSVCATAQHRDMLDPFLKLFRISPEYDLDVMQEKQTALEVASRIFSRIVPVLERAKPDWLIVQGDTTTAFAAAWAGFHHRTRIGHVEAGLRTRDKYQPFPEEMNRRLITVLGDLHFAPTRKAAENLEGEGIPKAQIHVTGNTIVDGVLSVLGTPVVFSDSRLSHLSGPLVLVTAHRRENFGKPLEDICRAVHELVDSHPQLTVVFPVHRNPAVTSTVFPILQNNSRVLLVDPLTYPECIHLMQQACLILTDSGGIQEEGPSVGTPVLVLREITERPEAVEAGWAEIVGTSRQKILERAEAWLQKSKDELSLSMGNPFGDGHAGQRIAEILLQDGRA